MTTNTDILYKSTSYWNRTQPQTTMDTSIILTVSIIIYVFSYAYGWGDVVCLCSLLGIYGSLYKLCDIVSTPPAPAVLPVEVEEDENQSEVEYEEYSDYVSEDDQEEYNGMPPLISMNDAQVNQQLQQVVNETNARNEMRRHSQRLLERQHETDKKIKAALTDLQQMIDNARNRTAASELVEDDLSQYEDDNDFNTLKEE